MSNMNTPRGPSTPFERSGNLPLSFSGLRPRNPTLSSPIVQNGRTNSTFLNRFPPQAPPTDRPRSNPEESANPRPLEDPLDEIQTELQAEANQPSEESVPFSEWQRDTGENDGRTELNDREDRNYKCQNENDIGLVNS